MLPNTPLFVIIQEVREWQGRLWLCEICIWWNGDEDILEMVDVTGAQSGRE